MFLRKDRCKRPPPPPKLDKGVIKDPPPKLDDIFFENPIFFDFFEIFRYKMTFYGMGNQFFGLSQLAKAVMGQKPKKTAFFNKRPPPNSRQILKKTPPPNLDPLKKTPHPPKLNNDLSSKTFPVLLPGNIRREDSVR